MTRSRFVDGWTFRREAETGDTAEVGVRLPHDAMLVEGRAADAPSGAHGSHFLGGRYVYTKRWDLSDEAANRDYGLMFEGVQGLTRVMVNGIPVGESVNGYTEFEVDLSPALVPGENVIHVHVDNSDQPNSRWYTGSGIYRPVWLTDRSAASFARDGLRFVTALADGSAELQLAFHTAGDVPADAVVRMSLWDEAGQAADAMASAQEGHLRVLVDDARLWTAEDPHLYRAVVQLMTTNGAVLDEEAVRVGLRTVQVEAGRGLLINGTPTLLRGACIHHDSGILGAATFRAAEFRRARILKENGYNAVRSSHNPLSRDMLDACDELGLYVMDELTDVWTAGKTAHDGSRYFTEHWRDDLAAMIAKDRNRPSVIMYSIGNEIAETATPAGIELTARLAAATRELDATRPVTESINFLVNLMASFNASPFEGEKKKTATGSAAPSKATSTAANAITNKIGSIMGVVSRLPRADRFTRDSFAHVDVAGYNYAASRYNGDAKRHPRRVIVGSETMPGDIAKNWARVRELPNVIGDFMWTGWDYLGEAGLGAWSYGDAARETKGPYPHLVAGSGAIDITGVPGAPALLARAVWGRLDAPAIAVRPLNHAGESVARSAWRSTDAIPSWSWRGRSGTVAEIEVYSDAAEVELLVNGRNLGRKPAGEKAGYLSRFTTPYEPGELVAIDRIDGRVRRTVLSSADTDLGLALTPDRLVLDADGDDLAFVAIQAADSTGVVEMLADEEIRVEVSGSGTLAALGSAAPATRHSYLDQTTDLFYGRALAVIRAGSNPGPITVTVTSRRLGTSRLELVTAEARPASDAFAVITTAD